MFNLLKFLIGFVALAVVGYFTFFVDLGEKTLYQHLVSISETREAKELGGELEKKAEDVKVEVIQRVPDIAENTKGDDNKKESPSDGSVTPNSNENSIAQNDHAADEAPLSSLSEKDRQALIELLKTKNN